MNDRGFTLVETLVAMVVLAVGLLAVSRMSVTYVQANTYSHQLSEASLLAQDKMELLRSYATSDSLGSFSVFDFDYLVSTDGAPDGFTSVADSTASGGSRTVYGLLSGSNGGAAATNGDTGARYEVLSQATCPSGAPSGTATCYSASDVIDTTTAQTSTGSGHSLTRTWWVQPVPGASSTDFAWLGVDSTWTDRLGNSRSVHLESMVYRR